MPTLILSVAFALCVLWAQARWVVSSALRALDARFANLSRLEAAALQGWLQRLRRAVLRAQRMGLEPVDRFFTRLDEVVPLINSFYPSSDRPELCAEAPSRLFPTDVQESLIEACARLLQSERDFLEALGGCAWSVDRGTGNLVETARFQRRIRSLQAGRRLLCIEKLQLTQNKWLRFLGLV